MEIREYVESGQVDRRCIDSKLDFLVDEVKRYGVSIAAIQESKWFGSDVWPASEDFVFLHSGRPVPVNNEQAIRREGVGILKLQLHGEVPVKCGIQLVQE